MNDPEGVSSPSSLDPKRTDPASQGGRMDPASQGDLAMCSFYVLFLTVGLAANLFMISSVWRSSTLVKRSSTKLTLSLLVSAAGFCLVACSGSSLMLLKKSMTEAPLNPTIWKVNFPMIFGMGTVYAYASAVLSVTRLSAMLWPSAHKKMMGNDRFAKYIVIITWIFPAIFSLPAVLGVFGSPDPDGYDFIAPTNETSVHRILRQTYKYMNFLPLYITCGSFVIMWFKIFSLRKARDHQTADRRKHFISQWQRGVTRALLASIITTFCCSGFHFFAHILEDMLSVLHIVKVSHLIYMVQYTLDPLLFFIFAKDYRDAVLQFSHHILQRISKTCVRDSKNEEIEISENRGPLEVSVDLHVASD